MKKHLLLSSVIIMMIALTGCAAAVISAGATGGYAVATGDQKNRAIEIARTAEGTVQVVDNLQVKR
jgi:osmotically-inducible protein OsmY